MTAHQQTKVNELKREFEVEKVWKDPASWSIYVDVWTGDGSALFKVSPSGFKQRIDREVLA